MLEKLKKFCRKDTDELMFLGFVFVVILITIVLALTVTGGFIDFLAKRDAPIVKQVEQEANYEYQVMGGFICNRGTGICRPIQ